MDRKNVLFCLLLILPLFFYGCQAANDAKLTTQVKTKITEDKQLDHSDISVETKNGVVTLTGKVESASQIEEATQIARSVTGVKDVVTNITAEGPATSMDSHPSDGNDAVHETGEAIDDASTTAKVKLALGKDDQVDALNINVDTENGVVTLTGNVKNQGEADRAVEVAKGVEGVKDVNSNLKVGS